MLTRTFLLTWYTAMMTRIDRASLEIQKGFHTSNFKSDHSPVTDVDLISHKILTEDWTQTAIISEESSKRLNEEILTWVDPLDATQEYTEGLRQYVSVMACLTQNGQPEAGIIHFPFLNETWAVIGDEWLERPAMSFQPPETVLVSRSHAGEVMKKIKGFPVITAGGSGYKGAEVLKGNALAYVHVTPIKTWDICAVDAVVRAANGTMVEWTTGLPFNYTKIKHTNGLFLSTTFSRTWFRLTETVRAPWAQFMIVMVAWVGIYLYPDETLVAPPKRKKQVISFVKCAFILLTTYIVWGICQERIMSVEYDGQKFTSPAVLVFVNRLVASSVAGHFVRKQTTPLFKLSIPSAANVISSLCQYAAASYTVYPIVIIFKSLKILPVLLVGRCVFNKRYNYKAYLIAVGIAIGVSLCLFSQYKTMANIEASGFGFILLIGYVFANAFTSQWQSYLFKEYKTPPLEMMYGENTCSVIFTGVLVFISGQFDASINFAMEHPVFLVHVAGLCIPAVIGQWFIYKTIEMHGAAAFSMIMTSRQAFSLVVSCLIFGHRFDVVAILGFGIVLGMLFLKSRISIEYKSKYVELPQKDPETGIDAEAYDYELDDYELESDHKD